MVSLSEMLESAVYNEQQVDQEIMRLTQIKWGLRGQIELLHSLIAQQQAATPEPPAMPEAERLD